MTCLFGCPIENHDDRGVCMYDCERCPDDCRTNGGVTWPPEGMRRSA